MKKTRSLEICMAAAEAHPYAKTGGLADVVGSLSEFLSLQNCRVHLFHPLYRRTREKLPTLERRSAAFTLEVGGESVPVEIYEHRPNPSLSLFFVREDSSFDRDGLYGDGEKDYPDNLRRFTIFSRAILETVRRMRLRPHVIHLHDWQTALVPLYLRHRLDLSGPFQSLPSLLTIHNLSYQGVFPAEFLNLSGIPRKFFTMEGVEFYGSINLLKGGIISSDAVSTVSVKYSREIQTPEFGAGLHDLLRRHRDRIYGILNGVDYKIWDPATDPHLPANYSRQNLTGKLTCKKMLLEEFGLNPDTDPPLIATVSRIIDQKGFDIIIPALPSLFGLGFRCVFLGTGDLKYQKLLEESAARFPEQCAVKIAYDESLAHRMEAGADFFLMPSRFEPCGLNQIFSLRYGTIPIVRATGGLDDTIDHYRPELGLGNGLKFEGYSPDALSSKAHEALLIYRDPTHRRNLINNAMAADFSWKASAERYIALYRKLIRERRTI